MNTGTNYQSLFNLSTAQLDTLIVNGDAIIGGDLQVDGDFHVDGNIDIHGTIEFHMNPVLLAGNINSALYLDGSQQVQSATLTNGQILIGSSAGVPTAANITATANQTTVTNGANSITIGTVQDIATTSSPTFNNLILNGLTASMPVKTNGSKQLTSSLISLTSDVTGILPIANGGTNSSAALTNTKLMVSSGGAIVEGTSSTNPTFNDITTNTLTSGSITNSGSIITDTLTVNSTSSLIGTVTAGNITVGGNLTLSSATATRLLATDASKVAQSVTITNANGTNLSFAGSTLAASMTQDLQTSATPTFANIIDSGLTASNVVVTNGSKQLTSSIGANNSSLVTNNSGALAWQGNFSNTSSNLVIGSTAGNSAVLAGTATGHILLGPATGRTIQAGSSPAIFIGSSAGFGATTGGGVLIGALAGFNITTGAANICIGGASGSNIITEDGNICLGSNSNITTGNTNSIALGSNSQTTASNQLMIGDSTLTAIERNASATVNIGTTTNPFNNIYLTKGLIQSTSNQLVLGTTNTTTLTAAPSSNRVLTFPDATDTLVGKATTDTLTNKTLTTPIINGATISIDDTDSAFVTNIVSTSTNTADRTLTFDLNNVSRTISLGGNITTGGAFTTTPANDLTFTTVGSTNISLPTSGTIITTTGIETLTNKTLTTPIINGATLSIDDTDSAFVTNIVSTSTNTADRTLTFDVNNANRTIGLGGNITTAADFITSGANSLTLTTTGSTNVTLPTAGTLVTLAGTETLTNKTLLDSTTTFQDQTSASAQMRFQLSGLGALRTITLPDFSFVPLSTNNAQTISADHTITGTPFWNGTTVFWTAKVGSTFPNVRGRMMSTSNVNTNTTFSYNFFRGSSPAWNTDDAADGMCYIQMTTPGQIILSCAPAGTDPATFASATPAIVIDTTNDITFGGDLFSDASNTYDMGTVAKRWKDIYCSNVKLSNNTSRSLILTAPQPATASRTVTIQDPGADCDVVVTTSNQTIAGTKTFSGAIKLATSGGTAADLNYYEEETVSATWTGAFTANQTANIYFRRIGKLVTLTVTGILAATSVGTVIALTAAFSAKYRPVVDIRVAGSIQNNSANDDGFALVDTGGQITWTTRTLGNYTNTGNGGFRGISVTYAVS